MSTAERLESVYRGESVTLRVLRALGWGPALLNLGWFRWRGPLNVLNLIPSSTRLAGAQLELVRRAVVLLGPQRGDLVLDIACGRGRAAYQIAATCPGAEVTGLDLAAESVAVARTLYGATRGLSYQVGDAEALPFAPDSVERALCLEAAFHFPDRARFLADARRVLKTGGKLVVVDFAWEDAAARDAAQRDPAAAIVKDTWGFRDFWTRAEYRAAAEAAGFRVASERDWTGAVTRPLQGQFDVLAWLGGRKWGRAMLVRSHATLASISRQEWQDVAKAARAHRLFHEHARYVCWELVKP